MFEAVGSETNDLVAKSMLHDLSRNPELATAADA